MGLRDQFTSVLGNALGQGVSLLGEAFAKAAPPSDSKDLSQSFVQAQPAIMPIAPATADPYGLLTDPFALVDQLGYRDKPGALAYNTLRQMSRAVPTWLGIMQTRLTQVAMFAQEQLDDAQPGYGVRLRDDKAHPTKQDQKRIKYLIDFIQHTGADYGENRDTFRTFLRKLTRDTLELDQACFEVTPNRKGIPAAFYALDGATIRLADASAGMGNDRQAVRYVQVYDEIQIAEWTSDNFCFGVRNPRSDIRANGYGYSELEMLINVVTASLWSFEYNKRQFSQGTMANGILNFKGSAQDSKVEGFRRQWKQYVSGVMNAGRMPMVNADELQYIDFGKNNRDMEYSAWMDFLIKVTCSVAQFDPAEINFSYGNSGQTSQMFTSPTESKIRDSRDRGLRPLLKDISGWINRHIIWPIDPSMEFAFLGLDSRSSSEAADLGKKQSEYLKTVDELRAEEDMDPLPDGKGAVILNPTWLQAAQAADMAAQGGAPGADPGADPNAMDPNQPDTGLGAMADQQANPESPATSDDDYAKLFPAKSLRATNDLNKARTTGKATAKVRIYEIDL